MKGAVLEFIAGWVGFCEGIVAGGAIAAFITILGIIPRLCWITRTARYIAWYEIAVVLGVLSSSLGYFLKPRLGMGGLAAVLFGFFAGIFIGLIAAALAEVLNVLPVMSRRMGITEFAGYIFVSLVLGKVVGSIIYWVFPQIWN